MSDRADELDPVEAARSLVLDKLSRRAHTRQELSDALAKKGIPAEAATEVLDRMTEVGLVDDQAFAESWVESRQQRRFLSKRALRQELQRKGVDRDDTEAALEGVDRDDEYAAAKALAVKKLRSMSALEPHVQRRRLAGALARRGFGPSIVGDVLQEISEPDGEDEPWFGSDESSW